jgi:hypothetical protein
MSIKNLTSTYKELISEDKTLSGVEFYKYNQKIKKTKKKYEKEKKESDKLKKNSNIEQ